MLGRFLEVSVHAPDILESLAFYESLGFTQAPVGETWSHPYAVVTDGRLFIGLHQYEFPSPSLTYVQPDLERHLEGLERLGIELVFRRVGADVFNEFVPVEEGDEPYPHIGFTSDTLNVSLLRTSALERPALVFAEADMPDRIQRLGESGFEFSRDLPRMLDPEGNALLEAPEGTLLLLTTG
jgi:hypothetical protein